MLNLQLFKLCEKRNDANKCNIAATVTMLPFRTLNRYDKNQNLRNFTEFVT